MENALAHLAAAQNLIKSAIATVSVPASSSSAPAADVSGDTPYNQVQQVSSHNSYNPSIHDPIAVQFEEYGIHSFELDIHAGDAGVPGSDLLGDNRPDGDYPVYHDSTPFDVPFVEFAEGDQSYYPFLSNGLEEIAGLNNSEPITLFVDVKGDPFANEGQLPADFDALLQEKLGDKLFTPQDMMDRVPGASTLTEAIQVGGWPTLDELDGRVMVVLTGNDDRLLEYAGTTTGMGAFIAPAPEISDHQAVYDLGNGEIDLGPVEHTFTANSEAIFYNMSQSGVDQATTIQDQGYVTRIYGFEEVNDSAKASEANHLGSDHIDPTENGWGDEDDSTPFDLIPEETLGEEGPI